MIKMNKKFFRRISAIIAGILFLCHQLSGRDAKVADKKSGERD